VRERDRETGRQKEDGNEKEKEREREREREREGGWRECEGMTQNGNTCGSGDVSRHGA
jgi:hypothetical protein